MNETTALSTNVIVPDHQWKAVPIGAFTRAPAYTLLEALFQDGDVELIVARDGLAGPCGGEYVAVRLARGKAGSL